ncbi:MAG TPA: gamma-glutamyl-gamma-aminobutyrate hydrolase family protein [Bdellovibrionota bacterium]|jgi:putative glutamine amidotransferase|nr:gamma-glutamyl-gamma-aminobutyrate hydrolase family protein [Bdellovibrionota bacterium]
MNRRPRIGISSRFLHPTAQAAIIKNKTVLYLEETVAHWLQSHGALTYVIPSVGNHGKVQIRDYADDLDALLLQGGADLCPESYGDTAQHPNWCGDIVRDRYEIELFNRFLELKKPIMGICRGIQLINVALGGTLTQDIDTHIKTPTKHRDAEVYDKNFHSVEILEGSLLERLYPGHKVAKVNSIHHQTLNKLGKGLKVEATSQGDELIEAVCLDDGENFVFGVQWHPEFHHCEASALDPAPLLAHFLERAKK